MFLSMIKKLNFGEPKPTQMTLTLADPSITYPYGILVMVNGLLFPDYFKFFDILKDSKKPLLLGRPFIETSKLFIDVALGKLIVRFNDEKVVFNMFEATKHQKENPQWY